MMKLIIIKKNIEKNSKKINYQNILTILNCENSFYINWNKLAMTDFYKVKIPSLPSISFSQYFKHFKLLENLNNKMIEQNIRRLFHLITFTIAIIVPKPPLQIVRIILI